MLTEFYFNYIYYGTVEIGFFANIVHFFQNSVGQKTISTVHKYVSSTYYPIFSPAGSKF